MKWKINLKKERKFEEIKWNQNNSKFLAVNSSETQFYFDVKKVFD